MVINTMRRVALVITLALATGAVSDALTIDPAGTRVHAEAVRATFPRPEASPGEAALVDYVMDVCERHGLRASVLDFSESDRGHSFSRVIEVVVPGDLPGTVMLVAPINHPDGVSADEDRSASVAAALAVMEAAARESEADTSARAHPTYRFLFPGAEYGDDPEYPRGSRRFLSDYFAEEPHALLYLDVTRLPISIASGGEGSVSPAWLLRDVVDAAWETGITPRVLASLNQLHRVGISDAPGRLEPYLMDGIPAIYLSSGEDGLTPPEVSEVAVRLAQMTTTWAEAYRAGVPDRWDRHYLYFQLGRRQIVIHEGVYIVALLVVLASTLLYSLLFHRRFVRYLRTIWRNLWNVPVLFLLVFGFLTAGTYLLELSLFLRGFPTIWHHYPGAYFAFKITFSFFLFSVAAQLLRHLPLSKNGSFYSAAALFVLFVDIILFSALSLSFSYYFVWAYVWAFFFSVLRFRGLKAAVFALAPFFIIRVAVEVLRIPELRLAEALLLSSTGDLLLSFVILPFLLMFIRLDYLIRHPVKGKRSFALRLASVVSGALLIGMVVFVVMSSPYSPANPQPIEAVERVDYPELERSLELSSPAPLGELQLLFAGEQREIDVSDRRYELTSNLLPDVLSVRLTYEDFLDRDRGRLVIDAPQPIEELSISFSSGEPMVLYDVSFPFAIAPDQRTAEVYVGKRPPLPLVVDFTVARGTSPSIEVVAESNVHPDALEIAGRGKEASTRLVARTRFGE
ncbi:MAG: hypothetical protein ACOC2Y_02225 [Spirochaetota bacterium]